MSVNVYIVCLSLYCGRSLIWRIKEFSDTKSWQIVACHAEPKIKTVFHPSGYTTLQMRAFRQCVYMDASSSFGV